MSTYKSIYHFFYYLSLSVLFNNCVYIYLQLQKCFEGELQKFLPNIIKHSLIYCLSKTKSNKRTYTIRTLTK